MPDAPHIFGIRHHGPGCARSLRTALDRLEPDCILVEGPPDADGILHFAAGADMQPPVALLVYDPENPKRAVYYPFAEFSPEWQAIRFGLERGVPVRFMDLPQALQLAAEKEPDVREIEQPDSEATHEAPDAPVGPDPGSTDVSLDPLSHLASAAGYSDTERWWEHMVEHRMEGGEIFPAILEAMTALRDAAIPSGLEQRNPLREQWREAWMRQTIRAAQKEGFQRIAVVCGAWHAPVLAAMPPVKYDTALLKGLPKTKVTATWVPWTYGRLTFATGYGAGIESPGWYEFIWKNARNPALPALWLSKVARLLREKELDASSASIIESVRLAEALAAVRGEPVPGLSEFLEATQAVLCFGDPLQLRLIHEKLIVSECLGTVPENTPSVPLAGDLTREQKRLRFPAEAIQKQADLDLRKPNDLDRSRLLHRLNLLGIPWGRTSGRRSSTKGTFHEVWSVQWQPEFSVALIVAGIFGSTIAGAASQKARQSSDGETSLPDLTPLLDATLLADLPEAAAHVMGRIQEVAAVSSDVAHLMQALPPLVNVARYGNVRQTDAAMVAGVIDGFVARICIGLPGACGSLNDEAAEKMFGLLVATHAAIHLLGNAGQSEAWHGVLKHLANSPSLHGLIAGRASRLLEESRVFDAEEAARRFHLALSTASEPALAAAWIDGFLRGSGLSLIHDDTLFTVVDDWVSTLSPEHFTAVLPLVRRTCGTFETAERRQLGERVARASVTAPRKINLPGNEAGFDKARADRALPLLGALLGLAPFPPNPDSQP